MVDYAMMCREFMPTTLSLPVVGSNFLDTSEDLLEEPGTLGLEIDNNVLNTLAPGFLANVEDIDIASLLVAALGGG